jgi:hypothetical protein
VEKIAVGTTVGAHGKGIQMGLANDSSDISVDYESEEDE